MLSKYFHWCSIKIKWLLVKVPMALTHSPAQFVPGWWWLGEPSWRGIVRSESLAVECHTPGTLKTSFINLWKEYVRCSLYERLHFSSLHKYPYFASDSQNFWSVWHIPPSFLSRFDLLLYLFSSRPQYSWNTARWVLSNNNVHLKVAFVLNIGRIIFMPLMAVYCSQRNEIYN